ncbi:MAG: hypothetical protein ACKOC0_09035 [Cytophagales bacterium]
MRKQQKSKTKPPRKGNRQKIATPPEQQSESENPFDFGGLPTRDLKKNLGCG